MHVSMHHCPSTTHITMYMITGYVLPFFSTTILHVYKYTVSLKTLLPKVDEFHFQTKTF